MPEASSVPKHPFFVRLKSWWSQVSLLLTIIGAVITGVMWVNSKFDEYAQRGVDISDLKESNAALRAELAVVNTRLSENVTAGREQIAQEFQHRDAVDRENRELTLAVRNEMRARHGVVTLAEDNTRVRISVREAEARSDAAATSSGAAAPQTDPLSGLDAL